MTVGFIKVIASIHKNDWIGTTDQLVTPCAFALPNWCNPNLVNERKHVWSELT